MDYKAIIKSIGCVIDNINIPSDKKELFSKSLQKIKERTKDPNIYLGIVGEFSSGKSTLINALIGADFLLQMQSREQPQLLRNSRILILSTSN